MESLYKKLSALLEELEKSVKADIYDSKVHKYPGNRPDMTEEQERAHSKLFNNANSRGPRTGTESSGEEHSDNYTASAHHYLKTGKALKFDPPAHAAIKERQHFRLPSMSGSKTKLEKAKKETKKKLPTPPPPIDTKDHPSSLSEAEAIKLVKKEVCKFDKNGQWKLE